MSPEIWKFTLGPLVSHIDMPDHARVISTAFQGADLRIWAVVMPSNRHRKREFFVVGTGHPAEGAVGPFVGTAIHDSGLVFHVFDRGYVDPKSTNG